MAILEVNHVQKIYKSRRSATRVEALSDLSFQVEKGEYVAIMGESVSGKSTCLNILAALDKPTAGSVLLNGKNLADISDDGIAAFRRDHLGFVFQDFNLLDSLTIKDNILLPLVLQQKKPSEMESVLMPLVRKVGIDTLLNKYPCEVSGGQKQRTAISRALITQPDLLLADEPTGALDSHSSAQILHLFDEINRSGQTILMVTHSAKAASHASRVLFIRDGSLYHEIRRSSFDHTSGEYTMDDMYNAIQSFLSTLKSEV